MLLESDLMKDFGTLWVRDAVPWMAPIRRVVV